MKTLFAIFTLCFSLSSFAFINDVECDGYNNDGQRMRVEIERSFGGGMRGARTIVYGARGTNPVETQYRIFQARKFGSRLEYLGDSGFRLEIDLFPDQAPRWGWTYRSRLGMNSLNCRFPNAQ